jgi:hypothetical protein
MLLQKSVNATEKFIGSVPMFTTCKYHQLCDPGKASDCLELCGLQDHLDFSLIHVGGKSYIKLAVSPFGASPSTEITRSGLFQLSQADAIIQVLRKAKKHKNVDFIGSQVDDIAF